jgi:predicted DNA-binding protein
MPSSKSTRSAEQRTEKHRKTHRLVQIWVSPKMRKALDALAKKEGRTLANYVRRELGKLAGIAE